MTKKTNKIFIISGPSGVGKTSVAKGVLKKLPFLKTTLTYTTRTKRLGKKEDKTIIHISEEEFRSKVATNDFLEWAVVHNNLYGTDAKFVKQELKKNSLLMNIDVQGALQIKKKMPEETILVFLKPENVKILAKRIIQREKMPAAILEIRLKNAKKEMALAKKYDYIITNKTGQLKATVKEVMAIIDQNTKS
ncbi:MAG: guanylate kinase [Patescibacteria group bacterium]|jgi:guanylate kinase|nr:guanylate kinase [Patescibacteria group bacterium]